jgi:hypothetical protein
MTRIGGTGPAAPISNDDPAPDAATADAPAAAPSAPPARSGPSAMDVRAKITSAAPPPDSEFDANDAKVAAKFGLDQATYEQTLAFRLAHGPDAPKFQNPGTLDPYRDTEPFTAADAAQAAQAHQTEQEWRGTLGFEEAHLKMVETAYDVANGIDITPPPPDPIGDAIGKGLRQVLGGGWFSGA